MTCGRGRWFSLGTPVSSTNKTNRHDITEILLKVALNTIYHNPFILFASKDFLNLLVFETGDYEPTWWRLIHEMRRVH